MGEERDEGGRGVKGEGEDGERSRRKGLLTFYSVCPKNLGLRARM